MSETTGLFDGEESATESETHDDVGRAGPTNPPRPTEDVRNIAGELYRTLGESQRRAFWTGVAPVVAGLALLPLHSLLGVGFLAVAAFQLAVSLEDRALGWAGFERLVPSPSMTMLGLLFGFLAGSVAQVFVTSAMLLWGAL